MNSNELSIINQIANDMAVMYTKGNLETQWPISSVEIMDTLLNNFIKDFYNVSKKVNDYPPRKLIEFRLMPTKISQMFFFLTPRTSADYLPKHEWVEMFHNLIEGIKKFRKDSTFQNSLELKENILPKIDHWNDITDKETNELLALSDSLNEMYHPIFRGFGHEIFEENGFIIRYYYDLKGFYSRIIIKEKVSQKPSLDFFGRIINPESAISAKFAVLRGGNQISTPFREAKEKIMTDIKNMRGRPLAINEIIKTITSALDVPYKNAVFERETFTPPKKPLIKEQLMDGVRKHFVRCLDE